MIGLIKKSITDKSFYTQDYKLVGRARTIFFGIFLVLVTVVFLTPIVSYRVFNFYGHIKDQILNIPPNLAVSYSNDSGLDANTAYPVVIKLMNNNFLIIDTKSTYKPAEKGTFEVVLKSRGYVIYNNGEIVDQQKYDIELNTPIYFEFKDIENVLQNVSNYYVLALFTILTSVSLLIKIAISSVLVILSFGTITYIAEDKDIKNITYRQSLKKFTFLLPFYLFGLIVNTLLWNPIPGLGILFIMVAYLKYDKGLKGGVGKK